MHLRIKDMGCDEVVQGTTEPINADHNDQREREAKAVLRMKQGRGRP